MDDSERIPLLQSRLTQASLSGDELAIPAPVIAGEGATVRENSKERQGPRRG